MKECKARIIIKYYDDIGLVYNKKAGELEGKEGDEWKNIKKEYPSILLSPLFTSISPSNIDSLKKMAENNDRSYIAPDFFSYFTINIPDNYEAKDVLKYINNQIKSDSNKYIERAYIEPLAVDPISFGKPFNRESMAFSSSSNLNLVSDQGYRKCAPYGLDIDYIWDKIQSTDMSDQVLVDVERAWLFNHSDLGLDESTTLLTWGDYENSAFDDVDPVKHGTSVLGVIAALNNDYLVTGIKPKAARIYCVSQMGNESNCNCISPSDSDECQRSCISNAILKATSKIIEVQNDIGVENRNNGDVILIESQTELLDGDGASGDLLPVEAEEASHIQIRLATALGITVVESAANGGVNIGTNLPSFTVEAEDNEGVDLDTDLPSSIVETELNDSGAIIVGGAQWDGSSPPSCSQATRWKRSSDSNYGKRVDCYAWGENVTTLSTYDESNDFPPAFSTTHYTHVFRGTSSASAIIAGAALIMQRRAKERIRTSLSPKQLRSIFSNSVYGTLTTDGPDSIGVMPDFRKIEDSYFDNPRPDIYIRDFIGDTGNIHGGMISTSPDVILKKDTVENPQASFGYASGTENNISLGSEAEYGQNNYVYVRVLNKGSKNATGVKATIYYSKPTTLAISSSWELIGTSDPIEVPFGDNSLTVTEGITWSDVPEAGHYCFIAFIGSNSVDTPLLADFQNDFDFFRSFIRNNKTVTWKNINIVNNNPTVTIGSAHFVKLPFIVAGIPNIASQMDFEVVSNLPSEAKVFIEMPKVFAENISVHMVSLSQSQNNKIAYIPMHQANNNIFQNIKFQKNEQVHVRLLIDLPKENRSSDFEIYARQVFENEEVGRVTWRLSQV